MVWDSLSDIHAYFLNIIYLWKNQCRRAYINSCFMPTNIIHKIRTCFAKSIKSQLSHIKRTFSKIVQFCELKYSVPNFFKKKIFFTLSNLKFKIDFEPLLDHTSLNYIILIHSKNMLRIITKYKKLI